MDWPDDLSLAFAISIVNARPPALTLAQYLDTLRAALVPGPPLQQTYKETDYLDGVVFWQKRFNALEEENTQLRARLVRLETAGAQADGKGDAVEERTRIRSRKRGTRTRPQPGDDFNQEADGALDRVLHERLFESSPINSVDAAVLDSLTVLYHARLEQGVSLGAVLLQWGRSLRCYLQKRCLLQDSTRDQVNDLLALCTTGLRLAAAQWQTGLAQDALSKRDLEQAGAQVVLELAASLPEHCLTILQACAQIPVHRLDTPHPLTFDIRAEVTSIALSIHVYTGGDRDLVLFRGLVEHIRTQLWCVYDFKGKTDLLREASRQALFYLTRLLGALDTDACCQEAADIFEQRLIRVMQDNNEIEQELWTLGLSKRWIIFA